MIPDARAVLTDNPNSALSQAAGPVLRKKPGKNWVWRLSLLAMAATVTYSAVSFWSLTARLDSLRQEASGLQQVLFEQQRHNQALQTEIQELQTDAYIEKVAREQLGLTKPGEIRYLTGGTSKVAEAPAPRTTAP